ncbi:hypothetical protein V9K92_10275 [Phyllobacterium sp. CCNWLW109]|uniref:hypothetical protein n=1 Tax=Phyllobacterium sp. CCNWLW109 TaxID=3127479 RepID=UPI003076B6A6
MTPEQKKLARHALGLPNRSRRTYRNRFVTNADHPEWSAMVVSGSARMRSGDTLPFGGDSMFWLTLDGAKAALDKGEKLCPEDFPVVVDRPLLFSGQMIRASLDDLKTMTRRLENSPLAKAKMGDRLWFRERTMCIAVRDGEIKVRYEADNHEPDIWFPLPDRLKFRPETGQRLSMGCYRETSRITAIVQNKTFEKLQQITEEDARAEGCFVGKVTGRVFASCTSMRLGGDEWSCARDWYADLWDSLNAKRGHGWDTNPTVVAVRYQVIKLNIDMVAA